MKKLGMLKNVYAYSYETDKAELKEIREAA
jgi:hypothetical protein